jgi:hypothetical protein
MRIFDAQRVDVIVGDGASTSRYNKPHVQFRYPKIKPLLLPGLKNAAIGGIIKV